MSASTHAKTVASIKRKRTKRLASLITKSYLLHRKKEEEKMYNLICEEFMSLGGVYVKFLQGVLLRSQVMKKWHNPEKLRIFENLDSEPIDIGRLLRHELPKDKLRLIALVQPEPFAAGSFGQVYYGQLHDGQAVIIKVLRPMIRELLRHDLRLLNMFSKRFFSTLYKNMSIQLNDALKEFAEATLRETDYIHEAQFADEMYRHYKDHKTIHIPRTYLDLCTENIIVQDYVSGISVAHIVRLHEQGVDPQAYVKEKIGSDIVYQLQAFGYESMIGIFEMPRIQGDPHPGNIRLMPNNKVGLIDFGISARPPDDKSGIYGLLETYDRVFEGSQTAMSLFESGLKFFVSDLYRSLRRIGDYAGKKASKDYVNEVGKIAEEVFAEATGTTIVNADFKKDASILMAINRLVNKGNRFGLVMKLEATEMLRAIQTYASLLSSLELFGDVMPDAL
jgi:predicted unusual protein kinase regulating ubiquinone biosynthesis (AarF/ABC1/UbiB family)